MKGNGIPSPLMVTAGQRGSAVCVLGREDAAAARLYDGRGPEADGCFKLTAIRYPFEIPTCENTINELKSLSVHRFTLPKIILSCRWV